MTELADTPDLKGSGSQEPEFKSRPAYINLLPRQCTWQNHYGLGSVMPANPRCDVRVI